MIPTAADVILLAPTRAEALDVGEGTSVIGRGRAEVAASLRSLHERAASGKPVAVCGTAERLSAAVEPGQLVVADEIWVSAGGHGAGGGPGGTGVPRPIPSAPLLAAELRRAGHRVAVGPVVTVDAEPTEHDRARLARAGALAVDRHSAWAAALADPATPLAVVCALRDPDGPGAMAVVDTRRAAVSLAGVRTPLVRWSRACGARRVVLAAPRSFCAGVERAIEIVERAIERFGSPVYVRRQIVHNTHVVARLSRMGAVFVEEISEVPDDAVVVLAAHGVSPEVRREAADRPDLRVVDATCPLVAKVHHEARRFASQGYEIVLIGHAEHEEVVGTLGEAPERLRLVSTVDEVGAIDVPEGAPVAYLTQTTLATDETAEVVGALKQRFPAIAGPSADDICYATQNRQDAVRSIASECDLVLVVGSANSSNTARLVEVARREGCRAELVEDAGQLRLTWLDGARTVGLTAGASAPESLVEGVARALSLLGPTELLERRTVEETVRFALPPQVR